MKKMSGADEDRVIAALVIARPLHHPAVMDIKGHGFKPEEEFIHKRG